MISKNSPLVSVVMPVYNAEKYLKEAIDSILNQTFKDYELIIVDDKSTDNSLNIIKEYAKNDKRIKLLKNEKNSGISTTLNNGIMNAKGKYIARMDGDDVCPDYRLQKQVEFLLKNPEVVIVGGSMEVCDMELKHLNFRNYNHNDELIRKKIFFFSPFCHASTMYKKESIIKAGLYNHLLDGAEDYDMYFRIGKFGKFANLPDVLYNMRVNNNGISISRGKRQERLTLYIRIKAVSEYSYKMNFKGKIYFLAQFISVYLIPFKLKYKLFNFLRKFWK